MLERQGGVSIRLRILVPGKRGREGARTRRLNRFGYFQGKELKGINQLERTQIKKRGEMLGG